jgi:hypothetical protein
MAMTCRALSGIPCLIDLIKLRSSLSALALVFLSTDDDFLIVHSHPVPSANARDIYLIYHWNLGNDRSYGYNGVSLDIDDRGWGQLRERQPVKRVGANGAALARREDQHTPGYTLALEWVTSLND